jgi:hypothetical protein
MKKFKLWEYAQKPTYLNSSDEKLMIMCNSISK